MPTPETVQKALREIGKSAANYRYLFENLKSPSWLAPLAQAGLFTNPPGREQVEGGFIFPGWAASQYLSRMAKIPEAQDEVLRIVLAMHETENVNVHSDLVNVALALPAAGAARLVVRARAWVQSPYQGLVKYHIGDLIAHLATGGQTGPALQLAKDVFALRPAPAPAEDEEDSILLPEPRAWLENWHYDEALKKCLPALVAADARHTLELVCGLLAQAIAFSRKAGDAEREDYSYIWHDAIEQDEHPPRLRNSLICAVRNAAEQAIKTDPANRVMVLEVLRRQEWAVFKRLELHILRQFLNLMLDAVVAIAPELVDLEGSTRHEAALLLGSAFSLFPAATQEAVLERVAAGPEEAGVVRWLEFIGVAPSAEKIAEYGLHWRAQRYTLIAEHVPDAWRAQVQDILARAGAVRRPDEVEGGATWIGPTSPKTTGDLIEMGTAQTLAYLREWTPSPGPFEATPEGLGRIFTEVIAKDLDGYVAQAGEFRAVDPTFVRFFFNGLESASKEKKSFAWPPVLGLAGWVVAQPREIPGRHKALMEADPDWSWTRGTIATVLEAGLREGPTQIPFEHRAQVWQIIDPLTNDPDPTPEHEAKYGGNNMDPATMAINTVRGKAFNTAIAYALWVRRHLDQLPARPAVTFDAMPEVRRVLDEHLDVGRDSSLTIRSVYGRYFPWLQHLDRTWAEGAVNRIFPAAPEQAPLCAAAWDTYLQFCQPYKDVLPVLRAQYARAVGAVAGYDPMAKRRFTPEVRLGEHLIVYYWLGTLPIDDPLVVDFFRLAPDKVRGHAIEYVGRSLGNTKQDLPPAIAQRLRDLWAWRLRTAQESRNIMAYREELAAFGWWFASRKLDDAWSMAQVRIVLDATRHIEPDFKVGETLEALAPKFPYDAVVSVMRMAEGSAHDWTIYGIRDHVTAILKVALGSANVEAKAAAERVVQYLMGRGHFEYRALLS
jgi:hypothetical protein